MRKITLLECVALVSLISLYGCSEESAFPSAQNVPTGQDGGTVSTIFELGICNQSNDGALVYVKDQSADYYCDGKSWKIDEDDADDEEAESSQSVKSRSSASKTTEDISSDDSDTPLSRGNTPFVTRSSSSEKPRSSGSVTPRSSESATPSSSESVTPSSSESVTPSSSESATPSSSESVTPSSSESVTPSSSESVTPSSSESVGSSSSDPSFSSSSEASANPPRIDEVTYFLENAETCSIHNIGHVIYVQFEDQGYICTESGYMTIVIERPDNISSSSVAGSSSSSVESSETQNLDSSADGPSSSEGAVSTIIDDRDGNEYRITTIGSQTWMAENLNYVTVNGFADNKKGSWCYNNQTANCAEYGRLYTWAAAMNISDDYNTSLYEGSATTGICPNGFRLPSNKDWKILADFISSTQHYLTDYGFSVQASGHYQDIADEGIVKGFDYGPNATPISGVEFWSSTQEGTTKAFHREHLSYNTLAVKSKLKIHAYSVRCVREALPPCTEANAGNFEKTNNDIMICKLNDEEFQWVYANSSEQLDYHFGRCSSMLLNDYNEKDGYIYICKRHYQGTDSNLVAYYGWEQAQGSDLYGYALNDLNCEDKVIKSSMFRVKQPLLPYSVGQEFYYCNEGEWRPATMLEYDTYNQTCTNGRVIEGNQNKNRYYYCDEGVWRSATQLEYDTYGQECIGGRIVKGNVNTTISYYCAAGTWRLATTTEIDTYGQECTNGRIVKGNVNTTTSYYCDAGTWRPATTTEIDTYGQECVNGRIVKGNVNTATSYYCAAGTWRLATTTEIDTYGQECFLGNVVPGNVNVLTYYFCASSGWRVATTLETDTFGEECSEPRALRGNVYSSNFYICDGTQWSSATKKNADTYLQTCVQNSITTGNVTTQQYICLDKKWYEYGCEGSTCEASITLHRGEEVTWSQSTTLIIRFDQTETFYSGLGCSILGSTNGYGTITVAGGQQYSSQWYVTAHFNGTAPEYAVVEVESGSFRCTVN